jgi:soluble lytic murein transglycosylase-like protein
LALKSSGASATTTTIKPTAKPKPKATKKAPVKKKGESPSLSGLSNKWPSSILQWSDLIGKYASSNDLDPNLVAGVAYQESWFPVDTYPAGYSRCPDGPNTSSCTSSAGAIGIMQVMPFHASGGEDLRDPETNISKGCGILRSYIGQMGSIRGGLAAYNAGPGGADQGGGWGYADGVLKAVSDHK